MMFFKRVRLVRHARKRPTSLRCLCPDVRSRPRNRDTLTHPLILLNADIKTNRQRK